MWQSSSSSASNYPLNSTFFILSLKFTFVRKVSFVRYFYNWKILYGRKRKTEWKELIFILKSGSEKHLDKVKGWEKAGWSWSFSFYFTPFLGGRVEKTVTSLGPEKRFIEQLLYTAPYHSRTHFPQWIWNLVLFYKLQKQTKKETNRGNRALN